MACSAGLLLLPPSACAVAAANRAARASRPALALGVATRDGRRPVESCATTVGELAMELRDVRRTDARPLSRMLSPIEFSSAGRLVRAEGVARFSISSSTTATSLVCADFLLLETLKPVLLPGTVSGLNGIEPSGLLMPAGRLMPTDGRRTEAPCDP